MPHSQSMSKDMKQNTVLYAMKEASFTAAYPMISGAYMQLFLSNKGMSAYSIGVFSTVVSIILMATSMCLSSFAETKANPLKQSNRLILLISLGFLLFLPTTMLDIDKRFLTLTITVLASVLTVLFALKSILEYKLPYQIIDMAHYGTLSSLNSALVGGVGIGANILFSFIIDSNAFGNPYLVCMIVAFVLFILSWVLAKQLKIINHSFDQKSKRKASFSEIWRVLKSKEFTIFIIPNALRGITLGITGFITTIAVVMGMSEGDASKLSIMMSIGTVAASLAYFFLIRKLPVDVIGLIGSILLCAIIFLPKNNTPVFLVLVLVAITGRVLVDNSVPIMCFHMIDPETAGTYHAWRCILNNIVSTVTVYFAGYLLETMSPIVLLIPCAAAYLICMVWYMYFYRKICKEKNIQI